MIRTCVLLLTILVAHVAVAQQAPAALKTEFTAEALQQPLFAPDGQQTPAGDVLEAYKGQTVLLYIWAKWCPDCLKGFPELKAFQAANPDVQVEYFSWDREEQRWKAGVRKFEPEGEPYWSEPEYNG